VTGIGSDFDRFIRYDETDLLSNTKRVGTVAHQPDLRQARRFRAGDLHLGVVAETLFDPNFRRRPDPGVRNVFESTVDLTGYAFLVVRAAPRRWFRCFA